MKRNIKIKLSRIIKSFHRNGSSLKVLDGLDVEAAEGELVSIVGPSGCGKSTLFNIVSGLVVPDGGDIYLGGRKVDNCQGMVSYMQQKDLLLPWRTVLGNAVLGLEIAGVPKKDARREAERLLIEFGLEGFEKYYPSRLSGGMRQRAALVRTILTKKGLMLLDEPFGALDAMTRSAMQEWLLKAWREHGKTILFITHDVEEAIILSDRIYVLTPRPGRVRATFEVDLERPRTITETSFVKLKANLLGILREEDTTDYVQESYRAAV